MSLEARERALVDLVEAYRDRECRVLLEAARAEAARIVDRAYARERARLHERVLAERAAARARVQAARAERDTRERAGRDRSRERLLGLAWPRLRETLAARWADPRERRTWIANALGQARRVLPPGTWTLRHAPGWPDAERRPVASELARALGAEPLVVLDPGLSAGIAIETQGAVLDASLDALLADRGRIEARLLALIEGQPQGDAGPGLRASEAFP